MAETNESSPAAPLSETKRRDVMRRAHLSPVARLSETEREHGELMRRATAHSDIMKPSEPRPSPPVMAETNESSPAAPLSETERVELLRRAMALWDIMKTFEPRTSSSFLLTRRCDELEEIAVSVITDEFNGAISQHASRETLQETVFCPHCLKHVVPPTMCTTTGAYHIQLWK